jgi:preprotein translocase subunit Sec63
MKTISKSSLDTGASKKDVKKAYKELSHIFHPDTLEGKPLNVQNRACIPSTECGPHELKS